MGKPSQTLRAVRALTHEKEHPLKDRKILFVDDDRAVRRVFARSFDYTGAQIDLASGPLEAIEMAANHDYEIIVTDLQMPSMNGVELIDVLWKLRPTTSFILVTGIVELDLPTESPSARAISSMIRKPWLPEQVDDALVQAIALHDRRVSQADSTTEAPQLVRALIIEGDHESGTLWTQLQELAGTSVSFECTHASRLGAAIRLLRTNDFHVIVSDLSLPDARGLDAVAGLRRAAPTLPIVVMSASDDEIVAMQAVTSGAQDYVVREHATAQALRRTLRYAIERKQTEERLAYLAQHDQLTGLANRSLFAVRATAVIAQAWARGTRPALLLLDLDRFKHVNDTLGHSVGDMLLVQVAERLRACAGNENALARLGGDEFAFIIEQKNTKDEAAVLARSLLDALEPDFSVKGHPISISASIGITVFPENGNDVDQLLGNADAAMYRAKETGRSRYQYFDQEMHVKALEWMELERGLRGALERNEFELHYQPQVDCQSNEVLSFEALLRWTHPTLGAVGPFRFVPVLESIGLIDKVGEWVIRQACDQLAKWRVFAPKLRVAVNVSAVQFETDELASIVRSALRESRLPEEALELEITEGLLMKDFDKTLRTLKDLNASGVRIAIDDFGTGYSNLSYLARYPIDVLKIDKSITDMVGAHEGDSIARAVVDLSHALGIEVLAEGVETQAQLTFLSDARVQIYQGYLYAKPMQAKDCDKLLGMHS